MVTCRSCIASFQWVHGRALLLTKLACAGRLSLQEFTSGCVVLGMRLSRGKAAQLFREMDVDGGGYVLFDEFCTWCVRQACLDDDSSEGEEENEEEDHHSDVVGDDEEDEEDEDADLYGATPDRGAM